ncbi:MAG TPA: hypothetical protein VFV10_09295 [Gammaproteobacteria bacterium]|nr:hypothetical protein [Gammaproteobacteria bacterium]
MIRWIRGTVLLLAAAAQAAAVGGSAAAADSATADVSATSGGAHPRVTVHFIPGSPALGQAARDYEAIWDEYGERIVHALEHRTCLPFPEAAVSAVVDDDISNSGGPEHAMQLRATYPRDLKEATLVHELGHRHLWQLVKRLDALDGHETLDLVLDLVWADVWGQRFAKDSVARESRWDGGYDYRAAWSRARSLSAKERARLWNELLALNGFPPACKGIADKVG